MIASRFVRIGSLLLLLQAAPVDAEAPARRQAQIKGLLVVELADGSVAGTASQMNATVVPGPEGDFRIAFNQPVGKSMALATIEVEEFIRVRHSEALPLGHRLELAFSDKYSPKDGPSAAVVCAILADSIITGDEIDPGFAATGDMTAAGQVREKLRAMLDKHTVAYSDSYTELSEFIEAVRGKRQWNGQLQRELDTRIGPVNSQRGKLLNNAEVQEELMLE